MSLPQGDMDCSRLLTILVGLDSAPHKHSFQAIPDVLWHLHASSCNYRKAKASQNLSVMFASLVGMLEMHLSNSRTALSGNWTRLLLSILTAHALQTPAYKHLNSDALIQNWIFQRINTIQLGRANMCFVEFHNLVEPELFKGINKDTDEEGLNLIFQLSF